MTRSPVHRATTCGLLVALISLSPLRASAQEQDQPSFLTDTVKRVVIDPTTYLPATISYDATYRDWQTSQPLFQHGFYERNPRYTVSGLPNDVPLSHGAGNRKILTDAMFNLGTSVTNNVTANIIERVLVERYPEHRKLWRTLGWVERISFASYMSYRLSIGHYRQAQWNEQVARQQGW